MPLLLELVIPTAHSNMDTFLALLFGLLYGTNASPLVCREQVCNGNADFCDRRYSNVSLIGTHDSAFVGEVFVRATRNPSTHSRADTKSLPQDPRVNQQKTLTEQLNAGIRFLQAQTHQLENGTLEMCHTSCDLLDAGSLSAYITTIKTWLDTHQDDVVTLLLVNGDNVPISSFDQVFASTGLSSYAYTAPTNTTTQLLPLDSWPTYSELIANNTRIVMFLDSGANQTQVPYLLDEFTYFFETPYDSTDPEFAQCDFDRPKGGTAEGRMYIVNHFLDANVLDTGILIPDNARDYQTNAATGNGSIGAQADLCTEKWGRRPSFVLVDMFDRGDVFTAQQMLNTV